MTTLSLDTVDNAATVDAPHHMACVYGGGGQIFSTQLKSATAMCLCRMKENEPSVTFCDGSVLHISQCVEGLGQDWTLSIVKLTSSLRRPPAIDLSALACLASLTLVTGPSKHTRNVRHFIIIIIIIIIYMYFA